MIERAAKVAAAFLGVILCLCIAGYALVFWVLVREPTLSEPMLELSEAPLCSSAADVRAALHAYVPEGTPYRDAVDSLVRIGFSIDGSSDESHVMFKRANECLVPPKGTAHYIGWRAEVPLVNGRTGDNWWVEYRSLGNAL